MLLINLGAGPQQILTFTLKWAYKNLAFKIVKGCAWNKICSLVCKLKWKQYKKIWFPFDQVKNKFANFGSLNKIQK